MRQWNKCGKRITVIAMLILLIAVLTYLIVDNIYRARSLDDPGFLETALYVALAMLAGVIYRYVFISLKKTSSKVIVSLGLSFAFVVLVFLANNYFKFLVINTYVNEHFCIHMGDGSAAFPYVGFLKEDLASTVGLGIFRYALAFAAMCAVNLIMAIWSEKILPLIKKYTLKIILVPVEQEDNNNADND